jgi:hypothetical protein
MISVLSHRQQLNGNKWFWLLLAAIILNACSPKIRPTPPPPPKPPVTTNKPPEAPKPPAPKPVLVKTSVISLILPFELDRLDLSTNATRQGLSSANLAIDYYQGFKLALDSLALNGFNYKLQVYDSKGDASQAHSLALNPKVRNSDLIVGPVYPESMQAFNAAYTGSKPIISPLSPANPAQFKMPNLVTVTPPLEYHAWRVAQYIYNDMHVRKVFILRSGFSDENKYLVPIRKALDSLGKKHIRIVYLTVVHGKLDALIPQLSATAENVFIVPATSQEFLTVTLRALDQLATTHPVTLFGHPNWAKASFLRPELLQRLKTCITTTDNVNYRSAETVSFIKRYRKVFHYEPGEYAIKGFDEGLYFGRLLATTPDAFTNLNRNSFDGLHNRFNFIKEDGYGWINTNVTLLQYQNFELKPVE